MMCAKDALKWIREDETDEQILEFISYEIPSEELECCPVYTVRTPKERPDGLAKTAPFDWPSLPPLGVDEMPENKLF